MIEAVRKVVLPLMPAFVVICGLVACSGTSKRSDDSAPPSAASPQRVARVYLRAAFTGNCDLTGDLTMSTTWELVRRPEIAGVSLGWQRLTRSGI